VKAFDVLTQGEHQRLAEPDDDIFSVGKITKSAQDTTKSNVRIQGEVDIAGDAGDRSEDPRLNVAHD
jgi:hypothetical protein